MTAIVKTPAELRQWRADLLAEASIPEDVLRERGTDGQREPEHYDIYETVRSIDYLLGEDNPQAC